jgi:hypothetical protein
MEAAESLVGPRVNEHLTRLIDSVCLSVVQERCVKVPTVISKITRRREGRLEGESLGFYYHYQRTKHFIYLISYFCLQLH